MNDAEFHDLLADYVAGELDERRAATWRAELESNPERRKLAHEYQAAAAALEANLLSPDQAEQRAESLDFDHAPSTRTGSPTVRVFDSGHRRSAYLRATLRYAAVIVIAFGAGFLARDWQSGDISTTPAAGAAKSSIDEQAAARFVQASESFPESSTFSRSLLMLARP